MKKILALILAAVMCFSLCACSDGEISNPDNNGSKQQSEQLPGESIANSADDTKDTSNATDASDTDTADDAANTENPYADDPNFECIFGQWVLPEKDKYLQDEIPCSSLTINEDKTCVVDGVPATWEFPDESYIQNTGKNLLDIVVYIDEEHHFVARYYTLYEWLGVFPYGYLGAVETSWEKISTT